MPQHGKPLFEFLHGHDRYLCELRDHGEVYGIEAQFWKNEEVFYSRRVRHANRAERPPREVAIAWAAEERAAIEKGSA